MNGDGYGDLVVGAQGYDNGSTNEGRAYVYLGSASGLATSAAWTAESDQSYASFGWAVSTAGDVNGDGYGDVVVGARAHDNGSTDEGRAYVYLGSASGLATSAAWTAESDQSSAYFGGVLASAGDVNGDGYGDVVVGVPSYDNGSTDEGRTYLYLGSASGLGTNATWTAESDQSSANQGCSLASAGDVNGDGYGDVVVGARYYDNGSTREGRTYLYLGSASGLGTSAVWTAESDQSTASFGSAVASAGDVNGDGYGDVVVGAYLFDNGSTDEGRAHVYLGSASGLAASAAWTAEANQSSGYLGWAVASAGDVNGDGYGDLLVGAPRYDNGSTDEGRAYVYLGSASGLATSAAWTAEPDQSSAYFGWSVASAGDVNGDGYGDVVVGAQGYDGGSTDEGRAYVYLGNGADGTMPLALAPQARQPASATPIPPGLASGSADAFDVSMRTARTSVGSGRVALQVEAKPLGTAFDGTNLVTGAYAASGTGGAALQETLGGLDGGPGYHWRARVSSAPAEGRPQGWGRWVYGGLSGDAVGGQVFVSNLLYADGDGDGHGDPSASLATRATTLAGYVADGDDCDDDDAWVSPDATEVCDAGDTDEDCDGLADDADDSVTGQSTFYYDPDSDGYGGSITAVACEQPNYHSPYAGDCDEGNRSINLGGTEVCDAANNDEDCDGLVDDADGSATGQSTFYSDPDGDGYGGSNTAVACEQPDYHSPYTGDCDEGNQSVNLGGTDTCGDGIDQDRSGADETCPSCTVSLTLPADGADLTSEGRFAWTGTCDGYRLELSPDPTFPAYDTIYNARLSAAANQSLVFPRWPGRTSPTASRKVATRGSSGPSPV